MMYPAQRGPSRFFDSGLPVIGVIFPAGSSIVQKGRISMDSFRIAIIGGGIVGCATALQLSRSGVSSLTVLEAEDELAAHQTGHNSGVIHSGLYYKPGSLKAKNCTGGREALYRFCETHSIPHDRCGKVVVATEERELPILETLFERGQQNGLTGLQKLSPGEILEHEPHVAGLAGIFVPQTGIVDFAAVNRKYAELARENDAQIKTNSRVVDVKSRLDALILETESGEIRCDYLINCGGLQCDRIARMCGTDPGLQIVPFRGEYYQLKEHAKALVNNLIYPVPDPEFPFLGVHFTRMIDGSREAGPNAVLALKREGYSKLSVSLRDSINTFTYPGFWKMVGRYWLDGMAEMYRSFSKDAFVRSLRKLIPDLDENDVEPAGAGVRAQALDPDGSLVDDFRILQSDRMIHVLNAPSPAATASLSIGRTIAHKAREQFSLD